jgi:hypothetical protein
MVSFHSGFGGIPLQELPKNNQEMAFLFGFGCFFI